MTTTLRTAIVHDWLVTYGGAERMLEEILRLFPNADLYALYDFIPAGQRDFIRNKPVTTSFLQRFPFARRNYRSYLPLMPLAVEQFDLSQYDLVISSSFAVAKGVITGPDQLHICVCYSPMRYAWDLTHQYLRQAKLIRGPRAWLAKYILHRLRIWDYRTACGVDQFIAISDFIARRIKKVYGRDSTIIYPPVDCAAFELCPHKDDFYLTASRLVPYKRVDLIVAAFASLPDRRLVVIGDGPEFESIRRLAGPNVTLLDRQSMEVLKDHLQRAKAFLFAAEEDFGILPVEAQACGTPVIAFGKGGALETVRDGITGLFFSEQTPPSVIDAIYRFESIQDRLDPAAMRANAERFSSARFQAEFKRFVDTAIQTHFARPGRPQPHRLILKSGVEVTEEIELSSRQT